MDQKKLMRSSVHLFTSIDIPIFMLTPSLLCFYAHSFSPLFYYIPTYSVPSVIVYWTFCFVFPNSILLVSVRSSWSYCCILNVADFALLYVFISYVMSCFQITVVQLSVHRPCCYNLSCVLVLCLIWISLWLTLDLQGGPQATKQEGSLTETFSVSLFCETKFCFSCQSARSSHCVTTQQPLEATGGVV
jgi:hypothetical protein